MGVFIEVIITLNIDNTNWVEWAKKAAILVIHTIFWPLQTSDVLNRNEPLSLSRLEEDGHPEEHKTCLGWDIQTLLLQVFLPKENEFS